MVFKGTEATGGLSQALAVVTLAGTLLVLVLKPKGRRVVAVLLAAAGVGLCLVGVLRWRPSGEAVRTKMRQVSLIDQYALTPTPWPWVFALAGVVVTCGAVLLVLGAASWPPRSDRFERDSQQDGPIDSDDPAQVWKALDAGVDPTAGAARADTPHPDGPDVHKHETGDTMGANHQSDGSARTVQSSSSE